MGIISLIGRTCEPIYAPSIIHTRFIYTKRKRCSKNASTQPPHLQPNRTKLSRTQSEYRTHRMISILTNRIKTMSMRALKRGAVAQRHFPRGGRVPIMCADRSQVRFGAIWCELCAHQEAKQLHRRRCSPDDPQHKRE